MNTRARHAIRTVAAALLGIGVAGTPVLTYAQPSGGAHVSGGSMAGHGSVPHFSGGPVGAPAASFHGATMSGGAHSPRYGYSPGRVAPGYSGGHYAGNGYYHGGTYNNGYWHGGYHGGGNYHGGYYWGGGYWHGGYWPHTYYYPGYLWFYPVLPIGYATFWWGGFPYYYYNNLYYTWNSGYNGYVVTDPPPVAGGGAEDGAGDGSAVTAAPPAEGAADAGAPGGGDIYVYPRNGQSEQQTSTDRYECHSWAVNQTGFDPTRPAQQSSGTVANYRRAMVACLDARGYSAR